MAESTPKMLMVREQTTGEMLGVVDSRKNKTKACQKISIKI